jgi:hypothetical protein
LAQGVLGGVADFGGGIVQGPDDGLFDGVVVFADILEGFEGVDFDEGFGFVPEHADETGDCGGGICADAAEHLCGAGANQRIVEIARRTHVQMFAEPGRGVSVDGLVDAIKRAVMAGQAGDEVGDGVGIGFGKETEVEGIIAGKIHPFAGGPVLIARFVPGPNTPSQRAEDGGEQDKNGKVFPHGTRLPAAWWRINFDFLYRWTAFYRKA